jgi:glucose-6-phosphate dehydrogenase assembly protein OpcA
VLNLVVYAEREVHARRAARTVADLAIRHPSRAIVVLGDRDREGVLASVQLHCHVPQVDGAQPILYEQILARVRGDFDERVASVVIPLLVPDLPVFLWWTGTPPREARHLDDLVKLADRLIVDSADFARADRTLPQVASLTRLRVGITDLNWARLTPWRELIAQFFDVPAWRPFLDAITGFRAGFAVDMDGRDIHPSQALLLLGWFASRLGWRRVESLAPSEAGGILFHMERADGAPVMVRLRPRFERGLEAGDVSGVRIQASSGGDTAEFVIKHAPDERHATATAVINGVVRVERVVPLSALAVRELLGEELAISGNDRVYEAALAAIMALAPALPHRA